MVHAIFFGAIAGIHVSADLTIVVSISRLSQREQLLSIDQGKGGLGSQISSPALIGPLATSPRPDITPVFLTSRCGCNISI